MKKLINTFLFLLPFALFGQDVASKYAESINKSDLIGLLSVLASDEMAGRELGTEGNKEAAKYISKHFVIQFIRIILQYYV